MAIGTLLGIGQGLGQVANYLQGRSAYGNIEDEIKRLNALKKKQFIDVNSISSAYERGLSADASKQGARLDRSLGLDTGQGAGQLLSNQIGAKSKLLGDLRLENQVGKARRNSQIDSMVSQLRAGNQKPNTLSMLLGLGSTALNTVAQNKLASQAEQTEQPRVSAGIDYGNHMTPVYANRGEGDAARTMLTGGMSAGYGFDNAGGFNQMAKPEKTLLDEAFEAKTIFEQTGLLPSKWKQGNTGNKIDFKPPTPTKTSSEVDGFIQERSQSILDQNKVEDRNQLNDLVQQGLNKTKWNWGNILPGGDPFSTPNPDTTGLGSLRQLDWYNNPANRNAIANDSLPNYKPELFGLPQEYENVGMSMFSDWDELNYQEKMEALRRKGIIQ